MRKQNLIFAVNTSYTIFKHVELILDAFRQFKTYLEKIEKFKNFDILGIIKVHKQDLKNAYK